MKAQCSYCYLTKEVEVEERQDVYCSYECYYKGNFNQSDNEHYMSTEIDPYQDLENHMVSKYND